MNKRQAKEYFKKINNTVGQHKSDSISNTKHIKNYTKSFPKNTVKKHKSNTKSIKHYTKSFPKPQPKRRGAHNKYYIPVKRGALLKPQPQIKGFDAYKGKSNYSTGIFDTLGELKGYNRAAQSAGNRIENMHPGFFDKYIKLGISKLLALIFDNYANYHNSSFYDTNESFVDEAKYEFLIDVLDEKLAEQEKVEE